MPTQTISETEKPEPQFLSDTGVGIPEYKYSLFAKIEKSLDQSANPEAVANIMADDFENLLKKHKDFALKVEEIKSKKGTTPLGLSRAYVGYIQKKVADKKAALGQDEQYRPSYLIEEEKAEKIFQIDSIRKAVFDEYVKDARRVRQDDVNENVYFLNEQTGIDWRNIGLELSQGEDENKLSWWQWPGRILGEALTPLNVPGQLLWSLFDRTESSGMYGVVKAPYESPTKIMQIGVELDPKRFVMFDNPVGAAIAHMRFSRDGAAADMSDLNPISPPDRVTDQFVLGREYYGNRAARVFPLNVIKTGGAYAKDLARPLYTAGFGEDLQTPGGHIIESTLIKPDLSGVDAIMGFAAGMVVDTPGQILASGLLGKLAKTAKQKFQMRSFKKEFAADWGKKLDSLIEQADSAAKESINEELGVAELGRRFEVKRLPQLPGSKIVPKFLTDPVTGLQASTPFKEQFASHISSELMQIKQIIGKIGEVGPGQRRFMLQALLQRKLEDPLIIDHLNQNSTFATMSKDALNLPKFNTDALLNVEGLRVKPEKGGVSPKPKFTYPERGPLGEPINRPGSADY